MIATDNDVREAGGSQPKVFPRVRKLLICHDAVFDLADEKWMLKNPWTTIKLKSGQQFPFRQSHLWLYAQLTRGIEPSRLHVEFRQKLHQDGKHWYRQIKVSHPPEVVTFDETEPLLAEAAVWKFEKVPFREEGIYEFRIVGDCYSHFQALEGEVAEVTMLERRAVL